jgi:hypothetical protein
VTLTLSRAVSRNALNRQVGLATDETRARNVLDSIDCSDTSHVAVSVRTKSLVQRSKLYLRLLEAERNGGYDAVQGGTSYAS